MGLKKEVLLPLALVLGILAVALFGLFVRFVLWGLCRKKKDDVDKSKLKRKKPVTGYPTQPMGKIPVHSYIDAIQISVDKKPPEVYRATYKHNDDTKHHKQRSLESQSKPLLDHGGDSDSSRSSSLSDLSSAQSVASSGKLNQQKKTKSTFTSELASHRKASSFDSGTDSMKVEPLGRRRPRFSEPAVGRRRPSSVVAITGCVGGHLEFILNYNMAESCLDVNLVRLLDLDLRPEYFLGTLEVVNKRERLKPTSVHLIMDEEKNLTISDASQLSLLVHAQVWPRTDVSKTSRAIPAKGQRVFNETLDFAGEYDRFMASKLMLYLLCKFGKGGEPIVLGEVVIGLASLKVGLPMSFMANICQPNQEIELEDVLGASSDLGELKLQLSFNPIAQKLTVDVLSGKWLPKLGVTGAPSTSVKVLLYHYQNRIAKRTTSIHKRTRNPNYNETFSFEISKEKLPNCDVLFIVRHHGAMYRARIGYVLIGCSAGSEGYKHWSDCMEFADVGRSHKILQLIPATLPLEAPK